MLRFALFEDGPAVSLSASHRHPRRTTASAPFARPSLFYVPHSPPSVYAAKRVSVSTFFRKNLLESIAPTTISPTTTIRSTDSIFIFEKPLPRFRRKFPLEFYVTKIMARLNRTRRAIPRGIAKRTRTKMYSAHAIGHTFSTAQNPLRHQFSEREARNVLRDTYSS